MKNNIIEIKYSLDSKWQWLAQDNDGSVSVFVKKPDLIDDMWDSPGEYLKISETGALFAEGWEASLKEI